MTRRPLAPFDGTRGPVVEVVELLDALRRGDYLTCPGCRTINPLDELDPAAPVCAECGRCL